MAGVNNSIIMVGTDFDQIKTNLITYLRSQDILKDASYTGSALSILLDILAYNTHYNAYYLNMVSNEMFLDTAIKRNSVLSHAKTLGYFPRSVSCSTALVNIQISGIEDNYFYIPRNTKFLSGKIDDKNYTFVTTKDYLVNVDSSGNALIENVILKQGEPNKYTFIYDSVTNLESKFTIPDEKIDIDTLRVTVQQSPTNINVDIYKRVDDPIALTGNDKVFFIQEGFDGNYQIYFGNGIIGKSLLDGNIIVVEYLSSYGPSSDGADSFYLVDSVAGSYKSLRVITTTPASGGQLKETIDSIKYAAPRSYQSQGRAVTTEDYKALILRNSRDFQIESVNVWSGEQNNPPVFGKVFVAIKPRGGYTITDSQKDRLIGDVIKPISVVTTEPVIVDVDYSYLNVHNTFLYDRTKTNLTPEEVTVGVVNAIKNFGANTLNTFESTLIVSELLDYINSSNPAIITNESMIYLEKRITPTFDAPNTYVFDFGVPIRRCSNSLRSAVSIRPSVQVYDYSVRDYLRTEVYIEETPSSATSLRSIEITNPGFNYTEPPTITILGDGTGATAHAELINGKISKIIIDNYGINYTQALVTITGGGGLMGSAKAVLEHQYGTLRSYFFDNKGVKTIFNSNVGIIDYYNGIVTLVDFEPHDVNNTLGLLSLYVTPETSIISSEKNRIITLDVTDGNAIKATAKIK